MNKNIIKIVVLLLVLILLIGCILFVVIAGIKLGPINVVKISDVANKNNEVSIANEDLKKAEAQYNMNKESLELTKQEFNEQKEKYENIGDETIAAIKEATKEEEYFIEYLWITLGNYATKHNLSLAVIEPGGTVSAKTQTPSTTTDENTVSTGTGTVGNSEGVSTTANAATTGSSTSGTKQNEATEKTNTATEANTTEVVASATALTVQVKGTYMDVADFVFEVENDKSLRFRLDNIKMKSAGGVDVTTTFNVKDFRVLKALTQ